MFNDGYEAWLNDAYFRYIGNDNNHGWPTNDAQQQQAWVWRPTADIPVVDLADATIDVTYPNWRTTTLGYTQGTFTVDESELQGYIYGGLNPTDEDDYLDKDDVESPELDEFLAGFHIVEDR